MLVVMRLTHPFSPGKSECRVCSEKSVFVSGFLSVCGDCIRSRPGEALPIAMDAHRRSRARFGLPPQPPRDPGGVVCPYCMNVCSIPEGGIGYCGLRGNKDGRLVSYGGVSRRGVVECYHDPLPTNCVADWCCAGGSGSGYPLYSLGCGGPEVGYKNLAVFYGGCSFNCLFCQNWHHKILSRDHRPVMSSEELASRVDLRTTCICFFGGDPGPQVAHALKTSRIALEEKKRSGRKTPLRVCWETNGFVSRKFLGRMARLSLETGGTIKVDLKAWTPSLYQALTGVPGSQVWENVELLAKIGREREAPPLLVVSTLLVPGYVDALEVENIAKRLAGLDPGIPYSLLAFYPHYMMRDLPTTPRRLAEECYERAKTYLENVRIGNVHLLS